MHPNVLIEANAALNIKYKDEKDKAKEDERKAAGKHRRR